MLPGHAIVLSTSSPWMRAQIEAWAARENAAPPGGGGRGGDSAPTCSSAGGGGGSVLSGLPRFAPAPAAAAHQPNIALRVRAGQEGAARALVRFIYEGAASLPGAPAAAAAGAGGAATQALLVDMLALACAFQVPTCAAAAAAAVAAARAALPLPGSPALSLCFPARRHGH